MTYYLPPSIGPLIERDAIYPAITCWLCEFHVQPHFSE
jgi:hypothetical protein